MNNQYLDSDLQKGFWPSVIVTIGPSVLLLFTYKTPLGNWITA